MSKLAFVSSLIVPGLAPTAAVGQAQPSATDSLVLVERGQAELDRFYFHDAESTLRKAVALDPNLARAHLFLARALIGQAPPNLRMFPDTEGVLPQAETEAKRAVELSPADPKALCVLGMVESKMAIGASDAREKARRLTESKDAFDRAPDGQSLHYHPRL